MRLRGDADGSRGDRARALREAKELVGELIDGERRRQNNNWDMLPAPEYPRERLLAALEPHADVAIDLLVALLDDADAVARSQAADLLGRLGHAHAARLVPVLYRAANGDWRDRSDAYPAIARLAPEQVIPLGLLREPDASLRRYILTLLPDPERARALASLFAIGDAGAVHAAVESLSDREVIEPLWRQKLVEALYHPDLDTARAAQHRLVETDTTDVLSQMVDAACARPALLTERSAAAIAVHGGSDAVLAAALGALPGDMGWAEERLLNSLLVLVAERRRGGATLADPDRWVAVVTRCLARPASTRALARGEFVLGAAARLAGLVGDPRLLEVLLADLGREPDYGFAHSAALVAAFDSFEASSQRLVALRDDPCQSKDVRRRANNVLTRLGAASR